MPIDLRLLGIACAGFMIVTTAGDTSGSSAALSAIEGTWAPVNLLGRDYSSFVPVNGDKTITLHPSSGQWSANDGCNEVMGPLRLDAAGGFTAVAESGTDVGCVLTPDQALPNVPVVERASSWRLAGAELFLAADDGTVLGVYRREPSQ